MYFKTLLPYILTAVVIFLSQDQCYAQKNTGDTVKIDFRFGDRYMSIYINNRAGAYVVKGKGSVFTEPFKQVFSADTSKIFRWRYITSFYTRIKKLYNKPWSAPDNTGDSERVEIYYRGKKIYNDYGLSEQFWNMFRPMMLHLPHKFNPFALDEHPFGG